MVEEAALGVQDDKACVENNLDQTANKATVHNDAAVFLSAVASFLLIAVYESRNSIPASWEAARVRWL